jgi:rhodanese-related sulfurtransferase
MSQTWRATCWVAAAVGLFACGASAGSPDVAPADVQRIVDGGNGSAVLLDVRTPAEFASGRVPGALNIPHTELEARLAEIEPHRSSDVIVYCESGARAAKAAALLVERGFTGVRHLEGDMSGWRDAGLPIAR